VATLFLRRNLRTRELEDKDMTLQLFVCRLDGDWRFPKNALTEINILQLKFEISAGNEKFGLFYYRYLLRITYL
jgi:hypothetical protein